MLRDPNYVFQHQQSREAVAYRKYLNEPDAALRSKLWAEYAAIHAKRPAAMVAAMEKNSGLSVR